MWADDLEGYAELVRRSPIPVAAGEWLATRFEFLDLMDRGVVHVAQPDVGRVGGLTEARRVCDLAAERGRLIVPHGWKTGITVAATAHLAAVTPHMPFFEFVPQEVAESRVAPRARARTSSSWSTASSRCRARPGLGIELDRDVARAVRADGCRRDVTHERREERDRPRERGASVHAEHPRGRRGEPLESVAVELDPEARPLRRGEGAVLEASSSIVSSLRSRDSQSSAGRNSKNGMCGVTIAR